MKMGRGGHKISLLKQFIVGICFFSNEAMMLNLMEFSDFLIEDGLLTFAIIPNPMKMAATRIR